MNKNVKRWLLQPPLVSQAAPFVQDVTVKTDTFSHTEWDVFFFSPCSEWWPAGDLSNTQLMAQSDTSVCNRWTKAAGGKQGTWSDTYTKST